MPRQTLPITSGFYVSEATGLVNRRLSNMYPIYPQSESATGSGLVHTPGINEELELPESKSRGAFVFSDGTEYRVYGNSFYKIESDNSYTDLGSIDGGADVSISTNGININILAPDGGNYFYTPETDVFETNTDAVYLDFESNYGKAQTVTFKDGYYVYTNPSVFFVGSNKNINDGKDFRATDFEDAEIAPDLITKGWNNHNQLYIMGETTIELYQTVVTSGFPFQRVTNGVIQKGCVAPNSVQDFDDGFVFIGGDVGELPAIWKGVGSTFFKISNSSIDQLMHQSSVSEIRNSSCWTYSQNGAYFAVFHIGQNTFVYDATASKLKGSPQWHARQTGVGDGVSFFPWRAIHGVLAYGKIRVGDDRSGKVGSLSKSTYTEYGETIERLIPTMPYTDGLKPVFSQEVELFMRVGLGNSLVDNPQIRMNYSDDGGDTFSTERWRSLGRIGQRGIRVRWSRLGRFPKSRMIQYKITDPVPVEIYGQYGNSEAT